MFYKLSYKQKLFSYFFLIFIAFAIIVGSFMYKREKQHRIKELESVLNSYTDFISSFIQHHNLFTTNDFSKLDSIMRILPEQELRITLIDLDGIVLYDNHHPEHWEMENHINRPEVKKALKASQGSDIRKSESTFKRYYYYAKHYNNNYLVRASLIYNVSVRELLKIEHFFVYFMALLFLLTSGILLYVSDKIGESIRKLKDFAVQASKSDKIETPVTFPQNELGVIGKEIVNIYNNLNASNKALKIEKDKLLYHLQMSQEGIAIFNEKHKTIFANNRFLQYINLISDNPIDNNNFLYEIDEFKAISDFIERHLNYTNEKTRKILPVKRVFIEKNMRCFDIQCIIFNDSSYEISVNDVTRSVKERKLKQQMTSNIAHELRTPVSSVKGYLETLLCNEDLPQEKQIYFIKKASSQIDRLSELIRDISLLTKIEEAKDLFEIEEVNITALINDVIENLQSDIEEVGAKILIDIGSSLKMKGNRSLLYSIFHNLLENSLNYGGNNVTVNITATTTDDNSIYFTFSDNGSGIDEKHHSRIFERFYRVDKGRARKNGGTGLGLAIVKNAVNFHKGNISVKARKNGGTEFLFTLA